MEHCRRLAIGLDQTCLRSEISWVVQHPEYAELNAAWEQVWKDMAETLARSQALNGFIEHYPDAAVHPTFSDV